MRFLTILLLLVLACSAAEALKKRQLQQAHAGYCPMHMMICNIYCPPTPLNLQTSRQISGCKSDNECASDEKCCKPACGCTNRCAKALEKAGFQKLPL